MRIARELNWTENKVGALARRYLHDRLEENKRQRKQNTLRDIIAEMRQAYQQVGEPFTTGRAREYEREIVARALTKGRWSTWQAFLRGEQSPIIPAKWREVE